MSDKESTTIETRAQGKKTRCGMLATLYGTKAVEDAKLRYASIADRARKVFAEAGFENDFHGLFYSAPGRTELGGNHTDHNRGLVLCAAVRPDMVACVAPTGGKKVFLRSDGFDRALELDLADLDPRPQERGTSAALLRGTAKALGELGVEPRGFSGYIHSEIPAGSGLSSSAAVELLFGVILSDLAEARIRPLDLARAGQFAENEYFGKPCGLMDQAAIALGGISFIDLALPRKPAPKRLDCDFGKNGFELMLVNTGSSHADLTGDYASIPEEMLAAADFFGAETLRDVDPGLCVARGPELRRALGDRALLRALHFFAENARVLEMREALEQKKLKKYLRLARSSGDSSWRLLQNLYPPGSPRQQGIPLALALSEDYLGKKGAWRVHGGGFAGSIQAYVPKRLSPGYRELMERYFGPRSIIKASIRSVGACRVIDAEKECL